MPTPLRGLLVLWTVVGSVAYQFPLILLPAPAARDEEPQPRKVTRTSENAAHRRPVNEREEVCLATKAVSVLEKLLVEVDLLCPRNDRAKGQAIATTSASLFICR